MAMMRWNLMTFIAMLCLSGCMVTKGVDAKMPTDLQSEVAGTYQYVPDSIPNPNITYREVLRLDLDSTFTYETRQNSFINYSTTGTWSVEGNSIVLLTDESYPRATVSKTQCEGSSKVKVSDLSGSPINFALVCKLSNQRDTTMYSSTAGIMKLPNLHLQDVSAVSSSGIASQVFSISQDTCVQVNIVLPNRRVFNQEKWRLFNGNIVPLNNFGEEQNYYLYPTQ